MSRARSGLELPENTLMLGMTVASLLLVLLLLVSLPPSRTNFIYDAVHVYVYVYVRVYGICML